jgi:hypothetical protein
MELSRYRSIKFMATVRIINGAIYEFGDILKWVDKREYSKIPISNLLLLNIKIK